MLQTARFDDFTKPETSFQRISQSTMMHPYLSSSSSWPNVMFFLNVVFRIQDVCET